MVVEASQIDRLPFQIGYDGFVLPVRVENESALAVFEHLRFTNNGDAARFFPGCRFVDQGNSFDDPVFVDIACPIAAGLNFFGEPLGLFKLADIADSFSFPQVVEVLAAEAFIKPGVLHFAFAEKFEGLLQKAGNVGGRVRVAGPKRSV